MNISFRKATIDDLPGIMEIIIYARNKMLADGKKQWDNSYPATEHITADISNEIAWVLCDDGKIVAYGAVVEGEPAYDDLKGGKWLSERPYMVVHRLAVARDARQHGIGSLFMRQVEQLARTLGIYSFRVDTNYDNTAMLALLQKLHFHYCGDVIYDSHKTRMAFEKLLTE